MKTLVIIAHPNMENSVVNKRWLKELEKEKEKFTIHKLYEVYPDENIDLKREQALVESHDNLILQFPIYWFNSPPLMKKWLDVVLTQGWAYGPEGEKMTNKKVALAVSAGGNEKDDYSIDGRYTATLEQVLLPFKLTFQYTSSIYKGFTTFYGAEHELTDMKLDNSAVNYIDFVKNI
mgnify:FL=1